MENTIYCIGGIGGKGGTYEKRLDTVGGASLIGNSKSPQVECLQLGEEGGKRWRQLASMSTPRSSHTCEVRSWNIWINVASLLPKVASLLPFR